MFHLIAVLLLISTKFSHQIEPLCYKIVTTDEINAAESYFGYSVQLRRSNAGGRVIVGAPRANSTVSEHASLRQPGAVFSCSFDSNCKQYVLDYEADTTHKVAPFFHYKHYKNDGWLGAVLDGDDSLSGPLMTCSPKWINQYYARQKQPYLQSGLCYVLDDASGLRDSADVLIPLQNTYKIFNNNMYNYAYGEAGISLHYVKDEEPSIIIGAPGVMDWQGTIARYTHPYSNKTLNVINRKQQGIKIDEKYSYFGFSVASGRFVKSERWYVSGAPRGAKLKGLVHVYAFSDDQIEIKHTMIGSEIGEYFGYSVTVVDVDNDKVDEIIIGAPMYSNNNRRTDSGRIYHFRVRNREFEEVEIVQQFNEKYARAGMAIGGIGDVNDDGYNDIAVGAPFANSGRGAVVIYYGSANGLKLGRTIFSTSVDRDLKGFGIGISRGVDVDNNGVEDFAVGAAFSGHVVVFKMFPHVSAKVELSSTPPEFSIKTEVIKVEACLTIASRHFPESLLVQSWLWFDDDRFHLEIPSREINIRKATKNCVIFKIAVRNNEPDLIKPLIVNVDFKPVSNTLGCNPRISFPSPGHKTLKINYLKGCENESVCQSNLIVSGRYDWPRPTLTIGERDTIQLNAFVKNTKDPAFKTRLYVTLPKFTTLYRATDKCNNFKGRSQQYCFNVGNPLGKNEMKKIVLHLKLNFEEMSYDKPLIVKLNATSHQEEVDESDNVIDVVLPFGKEEKLDLIPISQPEAISLNGDAKPSPIKHIVKINNLGPTPLDALKIDIFVPVIVEKRKLLKLQQMKATFKSIKTGNFDLLCNDNGITPLLLPWDHKKINESAHVNDIFVTCDSESLNVDCRKFTCRIESRILVRDQIEIILPAFIELDKMSKIDSNKYIMKIYTKVIVHKSGEQMQTTDIVTVIQRTVAGGFTKWVSIGVIIGVLCLIILTFVLFKFGCFKRKKYTNQGKIVSTNDYEFEEEK